MTHFYDSKSDEIGSNPAEFMTLFRDSEFRDLGSNSKYSSWHFQDYDSEYEDLSSNPNVFMALDLFFQRHLNSFGRFLQVIMESKC